MSGGQTWSVPIFTSRTQRRVVGRGSVLFCMAVRHYAANEQLERAVGLARPSQRYGQRAEVVPALSLKSLPGGDVEGSPLPGVAASLPTSSERQELSTLYRQRLDDFRGERCRYFRYLGCTSLLVFFSKLPPPCRYLRGESVLFRRAVVCVPQRGLVD